MAEHAGKPSPIKALIDSIRRLLRREPTPPPGDPYAYVTAPLRRGQKDEAALRWPKSKTIRIGHSRRAARARSIAGS
jgi:hypothetical protein